MSTIPIPAGQVDQPWVMPSKGRIGMFTVIVAESGIFIIFVIAYLFYIGKSPFGPTPKEVLEIPFYATICLFSSSLTIWLSERAIEHNQMKKFAAWWGLTFVLGSIFLIGTALEWQKLIYHDGLTISTNLFGTTFYSLVGLHASHVIVGLIMLGLVLVLTLTGHVTQKHAERIEVLALYWHFVDAIWVVVFTVVYIIGR